MSVTIAWLAQGKIRLKVGDATPRTVESRFGQDIRERAVKSQQRNAWKNGGEGNNFLAGAMLWGKVPRDPAAIRVSITSLCRGKEAGQMLYSLETDDLCGVLQLDQLGAEERRLWNKNDKRLERIAVSERGEVACAVRHQFGTANLAIRLNDESGFNEATEGDSYDTAPRWVPGEERKVVYQSAGVGRNREGHPVGLGPFAIHLIEVDRGELSTVAEHPNFDYLTPQMTADGTLYCIRRPYRTGPDFKPMQFAKDAVLFPFRVLYAVFQFLQFFSVKYSGKKLTTSGDTKAREMDLKRMMIWGNMVTAAQETHGEEPQDLVPKSWEFIRRKPGGSDEVLAKGVLAYDIEPNGTILYTNGSAIYRLADDGRAEQLVREGMIEQVIFVG